MHMEYGMVRNVHGFMLKQSKHRMRRTKETQRKTIRRREYSEIWKSESQSHKQSRACEETSAHWQKLIKSKFSKFDKLNSWCQNLK